MSLCFSDDNQTSNFYDESFECVSVLSGKGGKEGAHKSEIDQIICWLTGYTQRQLDGVLKKQTDFETFFKTAPKPNPLRSSIKGVICGVRIEEIQEPTMREIRYLDKLIDELAKGKSMQKILRTEL